MARQHSSGDGRGSGSSGDGLVAATVGDDGLLEALRLDPRVLRLGSHDLAEQVVAAVRAAQRRHLSQAAEATDAAAEPDPEPLVQRLDEMELQAAQDFDRLVSALDETLRRLEGR
ncbi:YbaB/EbfC family nucleoid-associated protein [Nonomuraea muscovyensis]|uniref:YbaB/EbfC family nucleoid-associated protein n=1 Tax=Nonomuraea muscovyensis TaxID=1124761 RepID=UPI0033C5F4B3